LRSTGAEEWPDGTVAARYSFLHALHQQMVYERVPAGRRSGLHRRIGAREEQAYGTHAGEIATSLAVHFERGRVYHRAVRYLQRAGENAMRLAAYQEAINHLTKALELLKTLPDTPERAQQQLLLLKTLGPALISLKGYGAPEVEHTYARAYALCHQEGRPRQLLGVLHGLQAFYLVRGEVRKARDLAEQAFQVAQSVATPTARMAAHGALGMSLHHVGELMAAREHLEQAWVLYNPQAHNPRVMRSWGDPGVLYLSYVAITSWLLGYPDQALEKARAALRLAHEVAHPYSLAFALTRVAALYFYRGEVQASQEHVEALIALATEQEFPDVLALETARQGVGLVEQGEVEAGIVQLQHGLAGMQALGQEIGRPSFLARLAMAYGKRGQPEEGRRVMAEALAAVDRTGERYYEAELYQLKGELSLQSGQVETSRSKSRRVRSPQSEVKKSSRFNGQRSTSLTPNTHQDAEECFRQAMDIARHQSAKSLELRAVMSLSRLWQQQGKRHEAHTMLSEVYHWFTEGLNTKDLQEAKALLEELA
jgi:predicted ATPase